MGSCISVHKDPESAMKLPFSIESKNEKVLIPSPVKERTDPVNAGNRSVGDVALKSQLSPVRFVHAGSKDEAFFDSQPWLESDCEDDFLSVNGVMHVRGHFLPKKEGGDRPDGIVPPDRMCSAALTIHGFKCQEYSVRTDDGYILSVQRIPEGRVGGGGQTRPPVLLQHGLLVDGVTWLMNSPEQSLAMILADSGYDVWISNIRGTRFSRRHVSFDPIYPEFWEWTWDDLMIHDLPSVIDLVFKQTGQQIHFAGHSMGTLMFLTSLSEGKLKNVKSAALLSPIAYLSNITSPIARAVANFFISELGEIIGVAEFDPKGPEAANLIQAMCANPMNCDDLITAFTGKNCCLNETAVENFLKVDLQSTATRNLAHLSQNVRNGVLSKYDYGNVYDNVQHYGVPEPPVYDLSKIPTDFPLFISYGGQDALADVEDVGLLLDILKIHNKDKMQVQYIEEYAHVDFIMGVDANDRVYKQIIEFFRKNN